MSGDSRKHLSELSMAELFRMEVEQQATVVTESLMSMEQEGMDEEQLGAVMRAAHSIKGAARLVDCHEAVEVAHGLEEWITRLKASGSLLDESGVDYLLEAIDTLEEIAREKEEGKRLPEATARQAQRVVELLRDTQPGGDEEVDPDVAAELREWDRRRTERRQDDRRDERAPEVAGERTLRIAAERFDLLMSLAGEATASARWLRPYADGMRRLKRQQRELLFDLEALRDGLRGLPGADAQRQRLEEAYQRAISGRDVLEEKVSELEVFDAKLEALASRLHAEVMASRMRPFRDGVRGLPRIVRRIARSVGKEVRLELSGLDTLLDREILQRLEAPLGHLLNNAVDHAIETPHEREQAGKPAEGTITLDALLQRGTVQIRVKDDGRGIDRARVVDKLVQRNVLDRGTASSLPDRELLEFILLPGFSTRDEVSSLSGRGVGLDAVADVVRSVGGHLEMESTAGKGSCFTLHLPATRAVMRALLVGIGGEPYAFPLSRIDRVLKIDLADTRAEDGVPCMKYGKDTAWLLPAARVLEVGSPRPLRGVVPALLIKEHGQTYAVLVDQLLGEKELITRTVPSQVGKVRDVSGVAILDNGEPVLILDADELLLSGKALIAKRDATLVEPPGAEPGPRRKRVLVVDDSITVRELERKLLQADGFEVSVAADGWAGWQAMRRELFDLVITDVDMPRLDGLQLVRMLKQDTMLRHIPVIMVSYMDRPHDRDRALDAGADRFVSKSSFHDDALRREVRHVLGEPLA